MTASSYAISAYVLGLGLLLGYAVQLWRALRAPVPIEAPIDANDRDGGQP